MPGKLGRKYIFVESIQGKMGRKNTFVSSMSWKWKEKDIFVLSMPGKMGREKIFLFRQCRGNGKKKKTVQLLEMHPQNWMGLIWNKGGKCKTHKRTYHAMQVSKSQLLPMETYSFKCSSKMAASMASARNKRMGLFP